MCRTLLLNSHYPNFCWRILACVQKSFVIVLIVCYVDHCKYHCCHFNDVVYLNYFHIKSIVRQDLHGIISEFCRRI